MNKNKSKNKFSVIISLFNKEFYIEQTIESIINQTFLPFEVIIVDDKSKDGGLLLVENIIKNYNGHIIFKIIKNNQNLGVSATRNIGIENLSKESEYVSFLDADDKYDVRYFEYINFVIEKYNADFIISQIKYKSFFNKIRPNYGLFCLFFNFKRLEKNIFFIKNHFKILLKYLPFGGSGIITLKKNNLKDLRFEIEETQFEDILFFFKIYLKSANRIYLKKILAYINLDKGSLSRRKIYNFEKLKFPKFYLYLEAIRNNTEIVDEIKKNFFYIWLYSNSKKLDYLNNIFLFKKYKKEIKKNFCITKFSIFYFLKYFICKLSRLIKCNFIF